MKTIKSYAKINLFLDVISKYKTGYHEIRSLFAEISLFDTIRYKKNKLNKLNYIDKKRILPCAAYLEGEYGISGVVVGVPVKLGKNGLEQIMELKLTPEESAALKESADAVRETVTIMNL